MNLLVVSLGSALTQAAFTKGTKELFKQWRLPCTGPVLCGDKHTVVRALHRLSRNPKTKDNPESRSVLKISISWRSPRTLSKKSRNISLRTTTGSTGDIAIETVGRFHSGSHKVKSPWQQPLAATGWSVRTRLLNQTRLVAEKLLLLWLSSHHYIFQTWLNDIHSIKKSKCLGQHAREATEDRVRNAECRRVGYGDGRGSLSDLD